jgi:DNA-binding IclR family transcriptional regulator
MITRSRRLQRRAQHGLALARPGPLPASGIGKALLAWSPVTREELETLPYHQGTDRTPADAESLTAELELARKTGYTINDEQTEWGYRIIGVPVLDRAGTARFALGIRGPPSS